MKRLLILAATTAGLLAGVTAQVAQAATCTTTGLYRDGVYLTAAVVDPTSAVTGTVDATGCNVGVYYSPASSGGTVSAEVYGANYFGVVDNASTAAVNVTSSWIHDIGESPFNGSQHGVDVFYTTLGGDSSGNNDVTTGPAASGTISGSTITRYQKGGVVVNGPGASVVVQGNTVTGNGPVDYIAQNGIEIARGATGTVSHNSVSGNEYTGMNDASSGGILVVGGPYYGNSFSSGISISNNTATNNDVGIWLFNAEADGSSPLTPTNNSVVNNKISKPDGLTNVSGDGYPCGYQAGIADQGNKDNVVNNKVNMPSGSCTVGGGTNSMAYDFSGSTGDHINNNDPSA
jgi:hypothetical protein